MMTITMEGPVYILSERTIRAFAEILNIILAAQGPADLDERLTQANKPGAAPLSGFFQWGFDNRTSCFWLKQRVAFNSPALFGKGVLRVPYHALYNRPDAAEIH